MKQDVEMEDLQIEGAGLEEQQVEDVEPGALRVADVEPVVRAHNCENGVW